jgi:hypothetical protein
MVVRGGSVEDLEPTKAAAFALLGHDWLQRRFVRERAWGTGVAEERAGKGLRPAPH